MSALPKPPLSKWFYAVAFVPLAIGVILAVVFFLRMVDSVQSMQRVPMPGTAEVTLAGGDWVFYGETYNAGSDSAGSTFSLNCQMADAASGAPVQLASPTGSVKYNIAGRSGVNMFEASVSGGTYTLTCTGDHVTVAIGRGIGTAIGVAVGGGLGGLVLTVIALILVRRQRHRAMRAMGIDPIPKPPPLNIKR